MSKETVLDIAAEFREMNDASVGGIIAVNARVIAERLEAAAKLYAEEMDKASEFITDYLQEIPLCKEPHNWLIRNGYEDKSYQGVSFGQEIVN